MCTVLCLERILKENQQGADQRLLHPFIGRGMNQRLKWSDHLYADCLVTPIRWTSHSQTARFAPFSLFALLMLLNCTTLSAFKLLGTEKRSAKYPPRVLPNAKVLAFLHRVKESMCCSSSSCILHCTALLCALLWIPLIAPMRGAVVVKILSVKSKSASQFRISF